MAFGVTPSGFPAPNPGPFPNFIQFRQDGVNLRGPDADTVDFGEGLTATRGTGEQENVITVTAEEQSGFVWRHVDGDAIIEGPDPETGEGGDIGNGISMDATSGSAVVVVPPDTIPPGKSVLVMQYGAASVAFTAQSGIELRIRAELGPSIAGQFGIITLIGLDDGSVLLCGDLTLL